MVDFKSYPTALISPKMEKFPKSSGFVERIKESIEKRAVTLEGDQADLLLLVSEGLLAPYWCKETICTSLTHRPKANHYVPQYLTNQEYSCTHSVRFLVILL